MPNWAGEAGMTRFFALAITLLLFFSYSSAQTSKIESVKGLRLGITEPVRDFKPREDQFNEIVRDRKGLLWNRGKRKSPALKPDPKAKFFKNDPLRFASPNTAQSRFSPLGDILAPEIGVNLDGIFAPELTPGDPTLCVGPNHVIQMVNGPSGAYFQVFSKAGVPLNNRTYLDNLVPGSGYSGAGDGICLYDQYADRYVMMEFGTPSGGNDINTLIFFVSRTADPLGQWWVYKFTDASFFPDYPKISVWSDAYYATTRDFSLPDNQFVGISCFAFNKQQMLSGAASVQMQRVRVNDVQKYDGLAPVNAFGPAAVSTGLPGLFVYRNDDARTDGNDVDSVGMLSFSVNFNNPANSRLEQYTSFAVAPFNPVICEDGGYFQACVTTPGNNPKLLASTSFVMDKVIYRRFTSHESILAYHTVNAGGGVAGIRWHELRRSGTGNWGLYQEGTYSPDDTHRFYPSMNMNSRGQIAAVYNVSSSTTWPGIRVSGRNQDDPPGQLTADETTIVNGTGYGTFSSRWGDYNMIAPDPLNDSIFWVTAMYGTPESWKTRIASIKLAPNKDIDAKLEQVLAPFNGQTYCEPSDILTRIIIRNAGNTTLTSLRVNWQLNNGTARNIQWSGSLDYKAADTIDLPIVITNPGNYSLRIYLDNPNGIADQRTSNDTLTNTFTVFSSVNAPLTEGFEGMRFPPENWNIFNPDEGSLTWTRTTLARKSGIASAYMNLFNYNGNDHLDYLLTPQVKFPEADSVIINFAHAYKRYSSSSSFSDTLMLMASTDCGNTFPYLIWKKGGNDLASTTGTTGDINWVPANSDWAVNRIGIPLGFFNGIRDLTFAWVSKNQYGQNVYIDDIGITALSIPQVDATLLSINTPEQRICSRTFSPSITIRNSGKNALTSVDLFIQLDNLPVVTRKITGLSLDYNQQVDYVMDSSFNLAIGGPHQVKVWISSPNAIADGNTGNDTLNRQFFVFDQVEAPLTESFEQAAFPPNNWLSEGNTAYKWSSTNAAASKGSRSAFARNYINNDYGDISELFMPPATIGPADTVFLKFDLSYINPFPENSPGDTLEVLVTGDCGRSYNSIYKKWGATLQTVNNPSIPALQEFIPSSPGEWRTDSVDITSYMAAGNPVQVIFRNINNYGNNLYLDNININSIILPAKLKEQGYLVSPNPTNGLVNIRHYREQENIRSVEVVNMLGQVIWRQQFSGNAPSFITVNLNNQPSGLYNIRVVYTNKVINQRVVKTNN
ncbi:T9SS type A sorting domain-containing protein [Flavihumibacter rivuli]|uniref:T9SS-dependent choice-of-anchor J family protein n=1 Tax=Flavihumibacter rivuli TaxID=2838156 RepID=UPI001BDE3AC9|nr:choice-of-anchor J domain-containing protein [Flavihumibacter rivuli]ULQ57930.1 T9SS type A sorting domain-containing protein [Flavihumibacter rivuli]